MTKQMERRKISRCKGKCEVGKCEGGKCEGDKCEGDKCEGGKRNFLKREGCTVVRRKFL